MFSVKQMLYLVWKEIAIALENTNYNLAMTQFKQLIVITQLLHIATINYMLHVKGNHLPKAWWMEKSCHLHSEVMKHMTDVYNI